MGDEYSGQTSNFSPNTTLSYLLSFLRLVDNKMGLVRCEFTLNGQAMSKLMVRLSNRTIEVPAFSGTQPLSNQAKHMCVPDVGAIPKGNYYILDRQVGGRLGWLYEQFSNKSEWFSLYAIDSKIDDQTFCDGTLRGQFRLHPAVGQGISRGCITLPSSQQYESIKSELKASGRYSVPGFDIPVYGIVSVK